VLIFFKGFVISQSTNQYVNLIAESIEASSFILTAVVEQAAKV
jgi:hypothetical protein